MLQTLVLRTSVSAGRQVVRLGQLLQLRLVSDVRVLRNFNLSVRSEKVAPKLQPKTWKE